MSESIIEYGMICSPADLKEFCALANRSIAQNWKPFHAPFRDNGWLYQAMVKYQGPEYATILKTERDHIVTENEQLRKRLRDLEWDAERLLDYIDGYEEGQAQFYDRLLHSEDLQNLRQSLEQKHGC